MQVAVSPAGEPDSYALQLLLKRSEDDGRFVRHFVCCECQGLIEAVQGRDYLHTCEGGHHADEAAPSTLTGSAVSTATVIEARS